MGFNIDGQHPDPEWEARLKQMSSTFRKLNTRVAVGHATPAPRHGETA